VTWLIGLDARIEMPRADGRTRGSRRGGSIELRNVVYFGVAPGTELIDRPESQRQVIVLVHFPGQT
jgi:hypothetical protein